MPDDDNVQTCPLAGISPTRIANWERSGVDAIEADLRNNRGLAYVGGPPGTEEQAWRWVPYKRAKEKAQQAEVFSFKLEKWGISINLKTAFQNIKDWWLRRHRS
jgi:hypothetical protein